ncbi:AAA family ATPase [Rheinheimera oceanensis]|uniref:AAA family ATPase n=1 Tax=Rheinheimera oceanensis TaxID=2817449 RepID=UPI001BFE38F5|nr:AAA family ATPase [Rheinheimera oceanensis]
MQIKRITRIERYRIFRDFTWPEALPNFARFNLIYGWNGVGKTTLSGLFSYLQTKQIMPEGRVEWLIDQRIVSSTNIANEQTPAVRVFNRDTVARSVFESSQGSLPPVYYLGEDSAEKQAQIEQLQAKVIELEKQKTELAGRQSAAVKRFESFCADQARAIKNLLTAQGSEFNTYNAARFKQSASGLFVAPHPRLSSTDVDKFTSIKSASAKEPIAVPSTNYPDFIDLNHQVDQVLGKTVVAATLAELTENPELSVWVRTGLHLHTGEQQKDTCGFCNQIIEPQRLQQLEAHFNDAFERFQVEISALLHEVKATKSFIEKLPLPDKQLLHEHLIANYDSEFQSLKQQTYMVSTMLGNIVKALETKAANPFKKLELRDFLVGGNGERQDTSKLKTFFEIVTTAGSAFSAAVGKNAFENIRSLIQQHNQHCEKFALAQRQARQALEIDEVNKAFESFSKQQDEIESLESQMLAVTIDISEASKTVKQLNIEIRQHSAAADELTNDLISYLGREELKFTTHAGGYNITRNGQPALHLSEGERTAISFIYFLKSLQDSSFNLQQGVVVIDDPISSLDANSIYSAFGFMKARIKDAGQVFVLTHNFTFFRQVTNWFKYTSANKYMLKADVGSDGRTAYLTILDPLLSKYESEYHYLFKTIVDASKLPDGAELAAYYSTANVARRLLETVLAFKLPDKAGDFNKQLEAIVNFDTGKKARIIRFTHSYSHLPGISEPEHDLSILSESKAILTDVLALIRAVDEVHYEKMLAMCN